MQDGSMSRRPSALASMAAPLQVRVFRRIWIASLISNMGILIGGVGAAWSMTQLTTDVAVIASVQTAAMLPSVLIALPAGAIADMYDRRKVGMAALSFSLLSASTLAILFYLGLITPAVLLVFVFLVGAGMSMYSPAWQASVSQQVPQAALPAAIALNSISYNIARSVGPAVGGVIVAALGSIAAFTTNALFYLPLLTMLFLWRPAVEPSRLPPERFGRAVVAGLRYVANSHIRVVLTRTFLHGVLGSAIMALMPLIARTLLNGGAELFGIMLGAFGVGAVLAAVNIDVLRRRMGSEQIVMLGSIALGLGALCVGLSRSPFITAPALLIVGAAWMTCVTTFNVGVQMSSPRWVAARAVATFQIATSGGIAAGSWIWGHTAASVGVGQTLMIAGVLLLTSPLLSLVLRIPQAAQAQPEVVGTAADPEVNLALTGRSGPIVVHLDYRVDPANAREFYRAMLDVQQSRQRNGAYGWSIARDVADPARWTERYHCPTWHDFLRMRDRPTDKDVEIRNRARAFMLDEPRARRMLERPFGSVRWKEDVRDPGVHEDLPTPPAPQSSG